MFRFFENFVDPYCDYPQSDTPPTTIGRFLLGFSKPFKMVFAVTGFMSIVVATVEMALIAYMGRVVDILTGSPQEVWIDHGTELIIAALLILLVRPVLQLLHVMLLNNAILPNFATLIRWRSHRHVLRQSVGWFENDFAGRIANRVIQTPGAAGEVVFQVFDAITFALAYVIGAAVLLGAADARLLFPLCIWLGLFALLIRWTVRHVGSASQAASDARSSLTGRVVDSYSNIHSVKLFAHQDQELAYAKEAIADTRETFSKEMRIYTVMNAILVTLNGGLIVGIVGWAIGLWAQDLASVGVVAAATALALRLTAMTGWIMWALTSFFRQLGVVAEGMETITQPIALMDNPSAAPLKLQAGEIRFEGLSHHYGRETGGIDNLNLTIGAGEKIGLIGRSGAGKSTLVKLLLRFYDVEQGRILMDGQDISLVTQDSLRSQIGLVQQDNALLHRSVRDNLLYGRPDANEAQILDAAHKAQAHDFILNLEDPEGRIGYDAHVGERGVKLSGGQRQRVTLARVILKNAPILILDEATSALDSEAEAAIQETLHHMMEGKTVIAIAHRLSTIAQMDRILVLDDGKIAEEGSHTELLEKKGLYAQFWSRQSGGFLNLEATTE